jgi:hypothetical protein
MISRPDVRRPLRPGTLTDTSLSGRRLACELDGAVAVRGWFPRCISDHGNELTSSAILTCAHKHGVEWVCVALACRSRTSSPILS